MSLHIKPVGDIVEHTDDDYCVCGPQPEAVKRPDGSIGWLIIHHALDGRD